MSESQRLPQSSEAFDDGGPVAPEEQHGPWDFGDLDGYIREGEPEQAARADNWQVAIGLQAVDGLKPSDYLLQTAKEHIEGRIGIDEAQRRISEYYERRNDRKEIEADSSEEADKASGNISKLLGEAAFTFSPVELQTIHRRIFDDILPRAGKYRTYNITKSEWVLKGETVYYASFDGIADALRYDFGQEEDFEYADLTNAEMVRHVSRFASDIWQVHPFGEGNTRTTAVFIIKYLRTLGFALDNKPFKKNSWYFRNALVRANYEDVMRGIKPTTVYLERFFENILFASQHELRNRYLHVDWDKWQTATQETGKETLDTTQETSVTTQQTTQERIVALLKKHPAITAKQLAAELGISFDGVRYHLAKLRKAGRIHHEGSTKKGRWVIDEQD